MKKAAIILLNYNGYKDTLDCIDSLKENIDMNSYKIIVVDNNSTDESYNKLKEIKDIKLIHSKINGGFSYGNNLGIKYALKQKYPYIILLNNDTIVTKNCFDPMYELMKKNNNIGILGNKVLYYDQKNKINSYGGTINYNRGTITLGYENKIDNKDIPNFQYVEFITGCCMMIRNEVFDTIGLLKEEYFMYYEDADFCHNAKKHFELAICGDSKIYHKISSSTGGKNSTFSIKWNTRNRMIFINKYCNKIKVFSFFYITRIIILFKYLISFKYKEFCSVIEGIKMGRKYIHEEK